MNKQTLISTSKLVFVIIAFANTACEMNIASNNQLNGNQVASNNLNGLPPLGGGMPGALPAAANGAPYLPRSVDSNIAAEQNRVHSVISTMAVENNPFAGATVAEDNHGPSRVVASYQPATVYHSSDLNRPPPLPGATNDVPDSATPPSGHAPPLPGGTPVSNYMGGGSTATR
jgi:hypothetical protein